MPALESRADRFQVAPGDRQAGIGTGIVQVQAGFMLDEALRALLAQRAGAGLDQFFPQGLELPQQCRLQRLLDAALDNLPQIRQPHAVSRQHASMRVQKDALHAQGIGHAAGMLRPGAAETAKGVFGHIVTALHRDLLDRIGHVLDGDLKKAFGHLLRGHAATSGLVDLVSQLPELLAHDRHIQRLVCIGPEHAREVLGLDLAEHDIAVGHAQRPSVAVAGRSRIGAGRFRADAKTRAVEAEDGTAAGGHGMDAHHRRAHAHAGHLSLEGTFELPGVVTDIGGSTAHVEADQAVKTGGTGRFHHADHAAGRAREDRILSGEATRLGQPTAGLHELQAVGAGVQLLQGRLDAIHIAAQDRRQIGIDNGGIAARNQLHQRTGLVRQGNLGKADLSRQLTGETLVTGMAVAVQKHDGDGADPGIEGLLQPFAQGFPVQRTYHLAPGIHTLARFQHPAVEHVGQMDAQGEQLGAVLIADAQGVGEALGDHQQGRIALAFEQGIGGHGGAHLDHKGLAGVHRSAGGSLTLEYAADAFDRRILVLRRVFRQQLVSHHPAVGTHRHHIGEGAAAVDPELPAGFGLLTIHHRLIICCGSQVAISGNTEISSTATISRKKNGIA